MSDSNKASFPGFSVEDVSAADAVVGVVVVVVDAVVDPKVRFASRLSKRVVDDEGLSGISVSDVVVVENGVADSLMVEMGVSVFIDVVVEVTLLKLPDDEVLRVAKVVFVICRFGTIKVVLAGFEVGLDA